MKPGECQGWGSHSRCLLDLDGDRTGMKEKGRAMGACLKDLDVPEDEKGKQT